MKKLNVAKKDACMACKACEIACSEAFYKKFDEDLSCIKISVQKDGVSPKPVVCVQCGKCAKVCPEGAITQNPKGVYMINKKTCLSIRRNGKSRRSRDSKQMYRLRHLRKSMSDGCSRD